MRFARGAGATLVVATHSRYVVDLNRESRGRLALSRAPTSPSSARRARSRTSRSGAEATAPDEAQIAARRAQYFDPYHAALAAEIERVRARHGYAVLLDGHSIRSEVPRFFAGRLPDLNLGTANGASCAPGARDA